MSLLRLLVKLHLFPPVSPILADADAELVFSVKVDINQAFKEAKHELIEQFERRYWSALLEAHHYNVSAAARVAGIHRKSAEYLLKKLKIKNPS